MKGSDYVRIGKHVLRDTVLGMATSQDNSSFPLSEWKKDCGCSAFRQGILGLDKTSDFLKTFVVQQDPATPTIFCFAYADDGAGTGENLFSLGDTPASIPPKLYG